MKRTVFTFCFALLIAATLSAQDSPVSFQIGGGFTHPVGNTGRHLDNGWNATGGVGFKMSSYFTPMIDLSYTSSNINAETVTNIGVPGGDVHVLALTLDPVVHLNPEGHADVYLTGGGGLYHRTQEFTQPGSATVIAFDPFFGFYPATVPTTEILSSYTVNKPGVDFGAGIALGTKWHGKFYAESRYNRIYYGNNRHSDYMPITLGFRW